MAGVALLSIVVLAAVAGFAVVPAASAASPATSAPFGASTALLSGVTALHGIILAGAVIVTGRAASGPELAAGLLATVLATVNLVGGCVVTDRMLHPLPDQAPEGHR